MFEMISIGTWIMGSIIVIGGMQYIKGLVPITGNWRKLYSLCSIVIAFAAAYAGGGAHVFWDFMGILAIAQIGYDVILQNLLKKLKGE